MGFSTTFVLLASALGSLCGASASSIDDTCESHLAPFNPRCIKFVVSQNGYEFAVRMPNHVTYGPATILRPYHDKRQASSTSVQTVVVAPSPSTSSSASPTASTVLVYGSPIMTSTTLNVNGSPTVIATTVLTPVDTVTPISWATITSAVLPPPTPTPPQSVVPFGKGDLKIEGQTGGKGKSYKLPNKRGDGDWCKRHKRDCGTLPSIKYPQSTSCFNDLLRQIGELAASNPTNTYAPLDHIACSPTMAGPLCAEVDTMDFRPVRQEGWHKLNTLTQHSLYWNMTGDQVPIGAIAQAMLWVNSTGALSCGNAIVPVPRDGNGNIYVLRVRPQPHDGSPLL